MAWTRSPLPQPDLMTGPDFRRHRAESDRQLLDAPACELARQFVAQFAADYHAGAGKRQVHQREHAPPRQRPRECLQLVELAGGNSSRRPPRRSMMPAMTSIGTLRAASS